MSITKSIRKFEQEFDLREAKILWKYPLLGFLSVFVGMPILVLICVCVSTTVIVLPIAWFFSFL